ncbi:MAG: hypothetical protein FWF78_02630 [Defluviitaleaceae bacterium]|nr:hypothetical protein [Defluviitaleaceae bacterium]
MKSISQILKSNKGITLVECVASILVFVVLIATVTTVLLASLRITARAEESAANMQQDVNAVFSGGEVAPLADEPERDVAIVFGIGSILVTVYVDVYRQGDFVAFEP